MADPKYANLPGIAHDQPDVFETSDLPESDQHLEGLIGGEEVNDSIETLHISTHEAMGKFRNKYLDSSKVDFSDRIRGIGRKGYVVFTGGDYDEDENSNETPVQKYQRLNCEVRELMDDIEKIKAQAENNKNEGGESLSGVALQVQGLNEQLSSLRLEQLLGSDRVMSLEDPSGSNVKNKLLNQLESLKSEKSSSRKEGITYEFYLKPELAKMQRQEDLAKLEKRLEAVEKALGASDEKMSVLNVETNQKSVIGAISVLSARTYLLEPSHLDHVEGRLFALHQKLHEISEIKSVIEDSDKANKISELYDLVQKNEAAAAALPEVVNRLEALEALHQRALQFNKALAELDAVQEKLVASLGNNQKLLEETQKKINDNVEVIRDNFATVEKRLETLGK